MERVLASKTNWLANHGYGITIVTTDQRGRQSYFPFHPSVKFIDIGINYDENNGRSFLNKALKFPIKHFRHRHRLTRVLKQEHADVVVCMFNNDVSFVYKIKDGSRKVLEIHFSKQKKLQYERHGFWRLADVWRTRQEEKYVRRYDCFVVLTQEDKELWGNMSNITVIPNARTICTLKRAELLQKRVLAVGRLEWQKGFDRLLDIWSQVSARIKGWELIIVGNGSLHGTLQKQIDSLGIGDSVSLQGSVKDMHAYYLNASIMVMTSRYEGLGMVLVEAQAFGLPTVAFACQCGPRDIITDGRDGYLVEDRDEALFAQRLITLMNDEGLRRQMGAAAIEASKRFSEEHIMQQWDTLFRSLS